MLKTKKKPRRASGANRLLRTDQARPDTEKLKTPHDYCNSENCRRCLAAGDGRILGIVARNRKTPAHGTLTAVYEGLFYRYLPNVDEFKSEFFKNVGGGS